MRRVIARFEIVIYPSEHKDIGRYTAHCLNLDVIADDDTVEGAMDRLLETIEFHLASAEANNADPFARAPERYWEYYRKARQLPSELSERIFSHANRRSGASSPQDRIAPSQVDARELQEA